LSIPAPCSEPRVSLSLDGDTVTGGGVLTLEATATSAGAPARPGQGTRRCPESYLPFSENA
jgi:hypothetical protein